ncbi:hypothetical protein ACVWYO_000040 [Sphingomonas sp. UYP23]
MLRQEADIHAIVAQQKAGWFRMRRSSCWLQRTQAIDRWHGAALVGTFDRRGRRNRDFQAQCNRDAMGLATLPLAASCEDLMDHVLCEAVLACPFSYNSPRRLKLSAYSRQSLRALNIVGGDSGVQHVTCADL